MGCSFSAISDDEDRYERLCKEYGEKEDPDGPYCNHARWLRLRDQGKCTITFEEFDKQEKLNKAFDKIKKAREELAKAQTEYEELLK